MNADFLIVGGGIAGTLLARKLARRGATVRLLHDPAKIGSSKVAAWMVNPVTGIRFVASWRVETFLPEAIRCYREMEAESGLKLWHPLVIRRFFQGGDERPRWEKKRRDPLIRSFVTEEFPEGLRIDGGGRVDLLPWLQQFLASPPRGIVVEEGIFSPDDLQRHGKVIFCTGHNPQSWFPPLPWKPAKGEILTLRIPGLGLEEIWLKGIFVLPLGDDLYRVGSTYEWDELDNIPTAAGAAEIFGKLRALTSRSWEMVNHQAAVRPILRDARPVLGLHAEHPRIGIFNGLGSKGALAAPWLAEHFAEHLIDGTPLDAEVDLRRLGRSHTEFF